ncbi:MAG: cytochrome c biogenesis protein ResB, partial [Bacteroidales bacterium]|nr:cytochrome c biogenesis protein ResB [Bacteroidales bacterium]
MKKLFDFFFSMQFALTLLAIFAVTIGAATFIENAHGTAAAKIIVYDATWFEVLLFLLAVSMTGNIFHNKLIQRKKYNVLIFHLAFVIILMGSAISRFIGHEGTMRIREGETSNKVITDQTYLQLRVNDGTNQFDFDEMVMFSSFRKNHFRKTIHFSDKSCKIQFVNYIPNAAQTFIENLNGIPIIAIVTVDGEGRHSNLLKEGESVGFGNYSICFNCADTSNNSINITLKEGELFFTSPIPVNVMHMESGITDSLEVKSEHTLNTRTLYSHDGNSFVIRSFIEKGEIKYVSAPAGSDHNLHNAIVLKITYEGKEEKAIIFGGKGYLGEKTITQINGVDFAISYGAKIENLPFYITLRDFQLDRYPGSKSPSSFASEVTLVDPRYDINEPRRIYMNNVLNYSGYRFFQSSYDQDEKGTILSVNHDQYGTLVTYIGYFLMSLGMLLHFFGKKSRFRALIKSSVKIREELKRASGIIVIILLTFSAAWGAKNEGDTIRGLIDKDHARCFGELLVQDNDGRIEPMNTLTSEVLRKIARSDKINELSADQVFLGMVSDPGYWQTVPMIKVSDPSLKDLLGLEGKYASFNDFLDLNYGSYKIGDYVDASYKKKPANRT